MPRDRPKPWDLIDFGPRLEQFEQQEKPPPDLLIIIGSWLLHLLDNADVGQRLTNMPGWRFAVIPGTHSGVDMVTCIFRVDTEARTATCSFFAYQAPPFGPA
ncbi:hypothetical protein [Actinoplanes xinjiangensis]|uniref:Uncharacterized protein n=1 Tax=Actinoplanes xinjiangensis TaxID=512350 RepID=A0A316F8B3_9ACTN|nr:hypothetical protein [Actinoplanes xinjiangensis]PWK33305.1 hypothetical protein BC793_12895 [Actinoplanes xinjiangensis]GIF43456.1 hypothetical protein Axi01nite_77670 [Actinoplanes xinjiangensis]